MDRRQFVGALAAPALALQTGRKYRTALIGSGWWGMNILTCALESGACQAIALCDVDENQLNPALERVVKLSGDQPRRYKDYRELLAKEKPEIAIVAPPDHWHALAMIEAVRSGAHVYVEKPIGHTVMEGRAMVKAAREADRVVQVGLHRRVSPHNLAAREFLRSGKAGKIGMVRAFVHSGGGPAKPSPDSDPPPGLDWDFYCGPAPKRPFNRAIHPRGFRQFMDFANGVVADWGVHWFDQVLWITGEQYPKRIFSTGGRFLREGPADSPDTQVASFQFDSFTLEWEHRQYAANEAEKHSLGCYFYGTEGTFHLGWLDGWTFYPAKKGSQVLHQEPRLGQPDDQNIRELFADFLEAIRAKRRPVSDIELGHRSTNLSLLAMVSLRVGRSLAWDGEKELVVGDAQANALLRRPYRAPWKYPG